MKAADEGGQSAILAREKDDEVGGGTNAEGRRKRPLLGERLGRIVGQCKATDRHGERRWIEQFNPRLN